MNGIGRLISEGFYYEGEWKDGVAHGKGTFVNDNGSVYKGEFYENK